MRSTDKCCVLQVIGLCLGCTFTARSQTYQCQATWGVQSDTGGISCSSYPPAPGSTPNESITYWVTYGSYGTGYPSTTRYGLCENVPSCSSHYHMNIQCSPRFGAPRVGAGTWSEVSSNSILSPETQNCSNSPPAPATAPFNLCASGESNTISYNNRNCQGSPIVIDPFGEGFHLTSLDNGVSFRLVPDTAMRQMSWTDKRWHNGWLALDRDDDGKIDNLTELFGNLTPQPESEDPNGFLALAVFDDPHNGGNGNGLIDPGDSVYSHLRLWIDANHNGVSEPEELHTLTEMGIFRIALKYASDDYVDANGNQFRYRGKVQDRAGLEHNACYDVFLVVAAENSLY